MNKKFSTEAQIKTLFKKDSRRIRLIQNWFWASFAERIIMYCSTDMEDTCVLYLTSFEGRNSNEILYVVSTWSFSVWVSLNLSPSTLKNTGAESSNLVMLTSSLNALSSVLVDAIMEEWFVWKCCHAIQNVTRNGLQPRPRLSLCLPCRWGETKGENSNNWQITDNWHL